MTKTVVDIAFDPAILIVMEIERTLRDTQSSSYDAQGQDETEGIDSSVVEGVSASNPSGISEGSRGIAMEVGVGPYPLAVPWGGCMDPEMSDADLFEYDTMAWLRKHNPDWSTEQIEESLRTIRLVSLMEFYDGAIKLHPDLRDKLPKLVPARPPKQQMDNP